jgi:hypothetical protein
MRAIIMAFFLFAPLVAFAEPSPTVKKLMNQPVSMFDFALYRLEQDIQSKFPESEIIVKYDSLKNRIIVHSNYFVTDDLLKSETPKQICKEHTNNLIIHSMMLGLFASPKAFDAKGKTDVDIQHDFWNNFKELNDITYIEVEVRRKSEKAKGPLAHSIRLITSDDFFFKE